MGEVEVEVSERMSLGGGEVEEGEDKALEMKVKEKHQKVEAAHPPSHLYATEAGTCPASISSGST